ncbi:MAG: hypothetical protein KatS3mg102_1489 [Planctomycetota bacterium]|nr:MAG: hypothetical protein KatS3mg102_1489 [Planctomycetota bacterium]
MELRAVASQPGTGSAAEAPPGRAPASPSAGAAASSTGAHAPAVAPELARTPAEAQLAERAQWLAGRLNEMPKYVLFLYNLLLDGNIEWRYKEHAFATLWYLFDDREGIIPNDDPLIGRLDDLAFVYRCFAELTGSLPQAKLALYEEVLARDGIPMRSYLMELPARMGEFYFAIAALYPETVARLKSRLGNAVATGELVRAVRSYLESFVPDDPHSEKIRRCVVFLDNYHLKK